MCGINAVQLHGRLISADKDHVQPLAALDSSIPNGKKDSDLIQFIIFGVVARLTIFEEIPLDFGYLYKNNRKCAALRLHKYMGGPLGPPKNSCCLWLHKIPF